MLWLMLAVWCVLGVCPRATAAPVVEGSPGAGSGSKLRVGVLQGLRSLDAARHSSPTAREIWLLVSDRLVGSSPSDLTPVAGLADSWSMSPDGRMWTFTIRGDALWHDGTSVSAGDVAACYRRALRTGVTPLAGSLRGVTAVRAVDARTLRIDCDRPRADLLDLWIPILRDAPGAGTVRAGSGELDVVGSGPFRLADWEPGEFVRLVAEPEYWAGRAMLDEVLFLTYEDAGTLVRDLQAGLIDAAYGLPPGKAAKVRGQSALVAEHVLTGVQDRLVIDCFADLASGAGALRDPAFRGALAAAVDREAMVRIGYAGSAVPGDGILPPGGRAAALGQRWRPPAVTGGAAGREQAMALLDAAGYPDTDGDGIRESAGVPISLRLLTASVPKQHQRAAKLIGGWFDAIGVPVTIEVAEPDEVRTRVERRRAGDPGADYDLLVSRVDETDTDTLLAGLASASVDVGNDSRWVNAEYDRLLTEQRIETDPDRRSELLRRLQEIVYAESPIVVLAYPEEIEAHNVARWRGWVPTPQPDGGVIFAGGGAASYLEVAPVVVADDPPASGFSRTEIAVATGASLVVVLVAGGLLLWRRRLGVGPAGMDDEGADSGGATCEK